MNKFKDKDMQAIIGWILRIGVSASMIIVFIGGVFFVYRHGHSIPDYKDFKGVIPSGYGAGIVEIWDSGHYADLDESAKAVAEKKLAAGIKAGNLKFRLYGKKLKGEFALVKLKGKGENSWLLIKHRDTFATDEVYNSEEKTPANSPINKWLLKNKEPEKKKPRAGSGSLTKK